MKVYSESSLTSFQFWAGAKDNAIRFTWDEMEQIEYVLEDIYPEGVEDTFINDLFWFSLDEVCELIGLRYDVDKDEIIRDEDEEEDEE